MNILNTIIVQYQSGGPMMHAIAICFAILIAIILERFVRIVMQYNIDGTSFMFEVQKYVLANDIDGAIRLCNGAGRAALPRIIKAGLQRASRDEHQIQNAVDAASLEVIPKIEKRLHYLALIANLSTLLGLLGTISGLIYSFGQLAIAPAAERQNVLSNGIAEALNCTAFGLIVAITAMIFHSWLSAKASTLIEEADEYSVKLIDLLSARKYKHSTEEA
ncbi:MAG: MotA/TolQ/ExbB proton channel family protein [Bdellovibrionota bacterium]